MKIRNDQINHVEFFENNEEKDENGSNQNVRVILEGSENNDECSSGSSSSSSSCSSSSHVKVSDLAFPVQKHLTNNWSVSSKMVKRELVSAANFKDIKNINHNINHKKMEIEKSLDNSKYVYFRNKYSALITDNLKKLFNRVILHAKNNFLFKKIKTNYLRFKLNEWRVKRKVIDKRNRKNSVYHHRNNTEDSIFKYSSSSSNTIEDYNKKNMTCNNYAGVFLKRKSEMYMRNSNEGNLKETSSSLSSRNVDRNQKRKEGQRKISAETYLSHLFREEKEAYNGDEKGEEKEKEMKNETWEINNKRVIENNLDKKYRDERSGVKYCDKWEMFHAKTREGKCIKRIAENVSEKNQSEESISIVSESFDEGDFPDDDASNKNSLFTLSKELYVEKYGDMNKNKDSGNKGIECSGNKQMKYFFLKNKRNEYFDRTGNKLLSNSKRGPDMKSVNICETENVFENKETDWVKQNKNVYEKYVREEKQMDTKFRYKDKYNKPAKEAYWNHAETDMLVEQLKRLIHTEPIHSGRSKVSNDKVVRKCYKDNITTEEEEKEKKNEQVREKERDQEHIKSTVKRYRSVDESQGDKRLIIENAEYNKLKREHDSTIHLIDSLISDISNIGNNYKDLKKEVKHTTFDRSVNTDLLDEAIQLSNEREKQPKKKDENEKLYITILYDEESLIKALDKLRISKKKQKKIEKNIFYKCKDNEVNTAKAILNCEDGNKLLLEKFNVRFLYSQIRCLRETQWLNDEVINFYFSMLQEHNTKNVNNAGEVQNSDFPKIYTFSTFFFQSLTSNGYNYRNVAKWTKRKKVDIFSFDLILIPLHVGGNHWTLGVINIKEKNIKLYDSLNLQNKNFFVYIKRYIADEAKDKKNEIIDLSQWTCSQNGTPEQGIPLQQNGYDCGVFTCMFAKCLTFGRDFDFNQGDIRDIRFKMAYDISKGCLQF